MKIYTSKHNYGLFGSMTFLSENPKNIENIGLLKSKPKNSSISVEHVIRSSTKRTAFLFD